MEEGVEAKGTSGEGGGVDLGGKYNPYPSALGKYEEVIADPKLFMETLEKLHHTLGTKFMVPTVGGKELNLHRLFVEVTSRGGIEKVIRERKWKEITAVFNFPATATNASFVLRKYYISLLHHYEQIYFFKSEGWNSSATSDPCTPSSNQHQAERAAENITPLSEALTGGVKRRRNTSDFVHGATMPLQKKCTVTGIIDGKFEHGYLVSVSCNGQKLQGVLYHLNENASQPAPLQGNPVSGTRRRRRKKKMSKLDPTHPKPNRSGYNFFFAEQHARLKPLHPGKDREISRMIGDLWNKLTDSEKAVYQEIGLKDKERYQSEMVVYREKQKTGQTLSTVMPLRQRPAELNVVLPEIDIKPKIEDGNSPSSPQTDSGSFTESDSEMDTSPTGEPCNEMDDFEMEKKDEGTKNECNAGEDLAAKEEETSINEH